MVSQTQLWFLYSQNIVDFWELPASRHTHELANSMERSFYLRCSEEKRPPYLRGVFPVPKDSDSDVESAGREIHDESLFKAIFNNFRRRIFWSSVILLVSGEYMNFLFSEKAVEPLPEFRHRSDNDAPPHQSIPHMDDRCLCVSQPVVIRSSTSSSSRFGEASWGRVWGRFSIYHFRDARLVHPIPCKL